MTEPTNPLFEDEKAFLERKKLEYERALRGDVEDIKETTVQVGKVALVGAGIFGGIWLLRKAFGGSKTKKKQQGRHNRPAFEDYAGFDGYDENDREFNDLDTDYQEGDEAYGQPGDHAAGDGFYFDGPAGAGDYAADDSDWRADEPAAAAPYDAHLAEDRGYDEGPAADDFADSSSYQARPYDDSRRLPHSDSFAEPLAAEEGGSNAAPAPRRRIIGPAIVAFAQSETGRVLVAQAAAIALALVTKAVQDIMPKHEAETGKNADLAPSSANQGVPPAPWPATSAAQDASAAAHHDDNLPHREPLA